MILTLLFSFQLDSFILIVSSLNIVKEPTGFWTDQPYCVVVLEWISPGNSVAWRRSCVGHLRSSYLLVTVRLRADHTFLLLVHLFSTTLSRPGWQSSGGTAVCSSLVDPMDNQYNNEGHCLPTSVSLNRLSFPSVHEPFLKAPLKKELEEVASLLRCLCVLSYIPPHHSELPEVEPCG